MKNSFKKISVLYDGDCGFCLRWARYWKTLLDRKEVSFYRYQKVLSQFPKLSEADCQKSIQVIETSGEVFSGAHAVFRLLRKKFFYGSFYFFYQRSKFFARLSESLYSFVASHRKFFSRFLKPPQKTTYHFSALLFLRLLAFVYMIAFFSLFSQVLGLYGAKGILPIQQFLTLIEQNIGVTRFFRFPTLFWFSSSDLMLQVICGLGLVAGLLMGLNRVTVLACVTAWICYLSFVSVGRDFMSFQWDILLLEAGFLAIFLVKRAKDPQPKSSFYFSKKVMFLFRLLLFRLMFLSGFVKLASGDEAWSKLSALTFHYETQPLPNPLSWYFHHLPLGFHEASVVMVFIIELALPFLIFGPRLARRFAGVVFILFQMLLMLSGNYTFFNLLTIALCCFLIDDDLLAKLSWKKLEKKVEPSLKIQTPTRTTLLWKKIKILFFVSFIFLNGVVFAKHLHFSTPTLNFLYAKTAVLAPLHLVNGYGLFAVMTKQRNEMIIEASMDGQEWKPYEFKYKPGDLQRSPSWIAPLQPRLDWQMWFAALSNIYRNPWFVRFLELLAKQEAEIVKMMAVIPYAEKPHYLRVQFYEYHFSSAENHKKGMFWERKLIGSYLRATKVS